ncbi:DUF7533 family protein [Halobaculum sp. P14]|uniref:DUF7533 family protein n=1 Tax=Halobaculum sp. P14 TaxID=3421638 RepID=UPI003EC01B16
MSLGIMEQLGLAGSLIFALPVAGYGIERAIGGDAVVGGAFVVVAVLMVVLPQRLTTPSDVPAKAAEKAVDSVVVEPDGESTDEAAVDDAN